MNLALIVLLPFLGAVLPPLMIRAGRDICALVTAGVTAASLALLLTHAPAVFRGEVILAEIPWVPQIGLDLAFFVDGYGLFFAFLILFIGLLIITYSRWYLGREDPLGRFYAYLLLFQGAMLGIALSDNVLVLLVFWELTSLTSFLLIGYWRQLPEGRQGARMALIVTGAGGLSLIAGMLLLGQAAGTYQLSEILTRGAEVRASPLYLPILLLVLGGAFTKSAQFPFHFWLPHAMAAPTPVSAYLHSATMVKAGIFLLGRIWPVLAGTEAWFLIVTGTGLVTMVIAAWIALYKDDLKALLAFSTVSHLGLVTMLFGMGTPIAAVAAVFHILNHCTFKAALFLVAGIVDHETGTRDARCLGGLLWLMPITGTLAMVAAASMAGPAAAQRLPLQGDDAGVRGAHRIRGLALAGARARHPGRAPVGRLLVPLCHRRLPRPDAARLPAPPARSPRRHVAAGSRARGPCGADRHRPGAGGARGRPRRRCRRRRAAARLPPGTVARPDAGPVHDRGRGRGGCLAPRGPPARPGAAVGAAPTRGQVHLRRSDRDTSLRRARADRRRPQRLAAEGPPSGGPGDARHRPLGLPGRPRMPPARGR